MVNFSGYFMLWNNFYLVFTIASTQFKSMRSATCAPSCRFNPVKCGIPSFNACTLNQVCKIKVRYWYSFNIILRTFNQLFCSSREDINEIIWPWGLHKAYKGLSEQCPYFRKKYLFKLYDSYNMSPGSWTLRFSSFWLNEYSLQFDIDFHIRLDVSAVISTMFVWFIFL